MISLRKQTVTAIIVKLTLSLCLQEFFFFTSLQQHRLGEANETCQEHVCVIFLHIESYFNSIFKTFFSWQLGTLKCSEKFIILINK